MNPLAVLSTLASFVTFACSPGPMRVSQSAQDPSNPAAPEGVAPPTAAVSSTAPTTDEHAHHDHDRGAPAGASSAVPTAGGDAGIIYACPMHPEVTSATPGTCPKCGMKLVQKK